MASRLGGRSTDTPGNDEQANAPDQLGELRHIGEHRTGRREPAFAEHPAQDEVGNAANDQQIGKSIWGSDP